MAEGVRPPVTCGGSRPGDGASGRGGSGNSSGHTTARMARHPHDLPNISLAAANRPALIAQQSSSLPSTPIPHSRELSDEFRTPSPSITNRPLPQVASPRSARSESDGTLRPPGRSTFLNGCPYETGMAYSRRRIPYSLGGDKLETSASRVRKRLESAEEKKLSEDMTALYERILPSEEDDARRAKFVAKLEKILNDRWPGNNIKVHIFGSSGNLLATKDSDVDICITTPMKALERVCLVAKALAEHGMERVVCVPSAKVPIVKIWDPELQVACDMNVNNTLALENTRMIKTYVQIDPRVRPLAMVVKHWTRKRILNDAALGGTLSSYTWICMIINFLQSRNPKILPTLQQRPHERRLDAQGNISAFADNLDSLKDYGSANKESLADLLFGFFRRYGHELDYERNVISVREGGLISKQSKNWHQLQNNRLCVEEPFNTSRNLGNTADDISFRGLHLELRRAFDLICEGKLDECCEQYIYPEVEEKIWTKPTPQPLPTLSRSLSQTRRSSRSSGSNSNTAAKSNTSGPKNRGNGASSRRASSAASSQKLFHQSPLVNGFPISNDAVGNQIHDHLYQHIQLLQAQEAQLRMQMQQKAQFNTGGKMPAHAQAQFAPTPRPQQASFEGLRRNSNIDPPPLSAPLRSLQDYYHPAQILPSRNVTPSSTNAYGQSTTSPPSPLINSARPVMPDTRQGIHRSVAADHPMAPTRSRSQPPLPANFVIGSRPVRSQQPLQMQPTTQGGILGYSSLQDYQRAWVQQRNAEYAAGGSAASRSPRMMAVQPEPIMDDRLPQEYIGYYVDQNYQAHPIRRDLFPHTPNFGPWAEMAGRPNGMSPSLNRVRAETTSRSPSPSRGTPSRDRSISFYSSATGLSVPPPPRSSANGQPTPSGPVIVDGSSDMPDEPTVPEPLYHPAIASDATSLSDDVAIDTPGTTTAATATPSHDSLDAFSPEPSTERRMTTSMPNMLQFGDFPARAAIRSGLSPSRDLSKAPEKPVMPPPEPRVNGVSKDALSGLGIEFGSTRLKDLPTPTQSGFSASASAAAAAAAAGTPTPTVAGLNLASSLKPSTLLSPVREVRTPSPSAARAAAAVALPALNVDGTSRNGHTRSASLSSKGKVSSPLVEPATPRRTDKGKAPEAQRPLSNGISSQPVIGPGPVRTSKGVTQAQPAQEARSPTVAQKGQPAKMPASPVVQSPQPPLVDQQPQPQKAQSPTVGQPHQASAWQQTTSKKSKHRKKTGTSGGGSGSGMMLPGSEEERKGG